MILVDKQILEYIGNGELIAAGFQEDSLSGVSVDLTVSCIIDPEANEASEYVIDSGETVFVKTREQLSIPSNILGRVAEKNSRMRQGLKVDAPYYQPGHKTYAFLRVQNISSKLITLREGMTIAQIMFEELADVPNVPYDKQTDASFQNEAEYVGLGSYKNEYEKDIKDKVEKANRELDEMSHKIYGNVLALMGILAAVFSILTTNAEALHHANIDARYVITMNLSMAMSIAILMGLVLLFLNKAKNKILLFIYIAILLLLILFVVFMIGGII